jgi:hypothetical protein
MAKLPAYYCQAEKCGKRIPVEKVYAAKSRGMEPRFCSPECRNRQTSREAYEARKKKGGK